MEEQQPAKRSWVWVIPALVAVLIAAGIIFYVRSSAGFLPAQVYAPGSSAVPAVNVPIASSDPTLGDDRAPVRIIVFSDFTCAECAAWYAPDSVFSQLKQTYIDTGKVYYVAKAFPLTQLHPEAQTAALAAACAQDQGKFWEYSDLLYTHQDKLDTLSLRAYAKQAKLDETVFSQCLTAQAHEGDITNNIKDGLAVGVTGTPTIVINGQLEDTDLSWTALQAHVERALASH